MYVKVDNDNFKKEVMDSDIPVLVDFWAPWCGPCKMIGPIIEEIGLEYQGKVKVCKIDVEDGRDIALRYGVSSIPTLIIFQNGEVKAQKVGAISKDGIVKMFRSYIQ